MKALLDQARRAMYELRNVASYEKIQYKREILLQSAKTLEALVSRLEVPNMPMNCLSELRKAEDQTDIVKL